MKVIIAHIALIATEKGGRKNPIFSGYKPNFVFFYDEQNLDQFWKHKRYVLTDNIHNADGVIEFEEEKISYKNGHVKCTIRMNHPDLVQKYLIPNAFFLIREGGTIVGTGEVISLIAVS